MAKAPVVDTLTYRELPRTAVATGSDLVTIQAADGGPVQAISLSRLFGRLGPVDIVVNSRAELTLAPDNGALAIVWGDVDPAKLGYWVKDGPPNAGTWVQSNVFKGSGAPGRPGDRGADGNTILSGATPPDASIGRNGDFYINFGSAPWLIYGPKAVGQWPAGVPIGGSGGGGGTGPSTGILDPNLTAPTVAADPASPANGSSPIFFVDSDDTLDVALGYKLVVEFRDKAGNLLGSGQSAALSDDPDGSDLALSNLNTLAAGTRRYRFRWERTDGSAWSAWSETVIVGPDDVEPLLSLPTKAEVGATSATIGFTTNEAGPRYTVIVPAAEETPDPVEVKSGQRWNGTAAPFVHTGGAVEGANAFSVSGFTALTAYKVCTVVEDTATPPNLSAVLVDVLTTASLAPATLWQGSAGVNRHADMGIDDTGFIATNAAGQGAPAFVRTIASPLPTKLKAEFTILALNSGNIYFGIAELAQSLANYLKPGNGSVPGWCMRVGTGSREFAFQNDSGLYSATAAAIGDVWNMEVDFTDIDAPIVFLDRKPSAGAAANVLGGLMIGSLVPEAPSLVVGIDNDASFKINNGQEPWVMAPRSGFVGAMA
jgi:hypothetical protein